MALDESKYKTLRFMRCKQCGEVFASGVGAVPECPDCASQNSTVYRPDGKDGLDEDANSSELAQND
jgi:predicted  nucleic acid-binding Zn-ribbon protein